MIEVLDVNSEDPMKQAKAQAQLDTINGLKELVSKDVLKTMQLLGVNYKAAIGEPLTELCSSKIRGIGGCKLNEKKK